MTYSIENKNALFLKMDAVLKDISAEILLYSGGFEKSSFFEFSGKEALQKKYRDEFYCFAEKLMALFGRLDDCIAELGEMAIDADDRMETETRDCLIAVFDKYEVIEKEIYIYTSSVEKSFKSKSASASLLLNAVRKLNMAFENLKNSLK